MKMLCLLGSPRRDGNSTCIARRFITTAESLGAEVTVYELNLLKFRGCQGCMSCKTTLDSCVLKDDLTPVLKAIRGKEADIYLLSSPIYDGEFPGQVKCFIDRCYSFLVRDYVPSHKTRVVPGKKGVLIVSQGGPEHAWVEFINKQQTGMKNRFNLDEVHVIRAWGVGSGGIPKGVPEKFLQQAEDLARSIIG
jgi:multimeric flavodoxin WrbA